MRKPLKITKMIFKKWMALDDALRTEYQVTAAGPILVGEDAEVAVTFSPALSKEEARDLIEALRDDPEQTSGDFQ